MNVRDPFGLHRNPAIGILRATATQAAREIKTKAIEAGANALEKGKQARDAVESAVEIALESASAATDDMAFNIPRNIPSFTSPQRLAEDQLWAASTRGNAGASGSTILGGVGGLLEGAGIHGRHSQGLPMYKDKPYAYPPSGRVRPIYRRKRVLTLLALVLLAAFYYLGWFDAHKERVSRAPLSWDWLNSKEEESPQSRVDWLSRRERVVEAFELSWDAYERYAWGMPTCLLFKVDANADVQATTSSTPSRKRASRWPPRVLGGSLWTPWTP